MEQIEIIKTWTIHGRDFKAIEKELHVQFGKHALKRSTIYKYMNEARFAAPEPNEHGKPGRPIDTQLLRKIERTIKLWPYASVRMLAQLTNTPPVTVHRYLTQYLCYVYKFTKWIPHFLSSPQLRQREVESKSLFLVLKKSQHNGWHDIVTGDQSWFTLQYGPRGAWVAREDQAPSFAKTTIESKKIMLTIIWGVYDFYIVDFMPEGRRFNTDYLIKAILEPLSKKRNEIWNRSSKRKIWLHLDNCRVHNSNRALNSYRFFGFKRTPHPPYSPDIAPSDFFLFGYIKTKLRGHFFEDIESLKEKIVEILKGISLEKRKDVFNEWMERCYWIAMHQGHYYRDEQYMTE